MGIVAIGPPRPAERDIRLCFLHTSSRVTAGLFGAKRDSAWSVQRAVAHSVVVGYAPAARAANSPTACVT